MLKFAAPAPYQDNNLRKVSSMEGANKRVPGDMPTTSTVAVVMSSIIMSWRWLKACARPKGGEQAMCPRQSRVRGSARAHEEGGGGLSANVYMQANRGKR